jgi:hypothetical protein
MCCRWSVLALNVEFVSEQNLKTVEKKVSRRAAVPSLERADLAVQQPKQSLHACL